MKSDFPNTLRFLYALQSFGIKLGLENIRALLHHLGNPHEKFPAVHVAGTNGKGSTCAMIAAALTASGYTTGLYTSPHLVRFNERIRINGVDIPDEVLVRYTELLKPYIVARKATFFEATTAIAFAWFAEQHVDAAVIEVGLGGLYDATNVLTPAVSIITTIGMDHMEYLGNTIPKIAAQKAGIIKPGVPVVLGVMPPAAEKVCKTIARQKSSVCRSVTDDVAVEIVAEEIDGLEISFKAKGEKPQYLRVALGGRQQGANAATALLALDTLRKNSGFLRLNAVSIYKGFSNIQLLAGLHGRMDILNTKPLVIGDVAHNAQAFATLIPELRRLIPGQCVVVFGVMGDKDYRAILRELIPVARMIIAVQPEIGRALNAKDLCSAAHDLKIACRIGGSVQKGYQLALQERREGEYILIAGSHYVLGEAMAVD